MESIEKAMSMLMSEFRKEHGSEAKLDDGDEICGVCNDGVIIISLENRQLSVKVLAGEPYKLDINLDLLEKEEAETPETNAIVIKKLYKCNEDGVAEWCVAESEQQAYEFMIEAWGEGTMQEYVEDYLRDNREETIDDFIDSFFIEEDEEREFTINDFNDGKPLTQKVKVWLEQVKTVPSYFCCEDF